MTGVFCATWCSISPAEDGKSRPAHRKPPLPIPAKALRTDRPGPDTSTGCQKRREPCFQLRQKRGVLHFSQGFTYDTVVFSTDVWESFSGGRLFCLTILNDNVQYRMRNYSITEAAKELGTQRATLYEWIRRKKIPMPTAQVISGVRFRFWTEEELKLLKKYKAEHYQQKPSRKRKHKIGNIK